MDNPDQKKVDEKSQSLATENISSKKKKLPPVKELLVGSWNLMTKKLMKMIFMGLLLIGLTLGSLLIGFVFILMAGGMAAIAGGSGSMPLFVTLGLIFGGVFIALSMAFSAAWILMLDDKQEETSVFTYFKRGFPFVIPLFVTGLLMSFLVIGGFFVFIIPAIIISVFMMLANYVVILEGKRWMGAVKMSAGIIAQNFGAIFGRILLLWLFQIVFNLLIQGLLNNPNQTVSGSAGILVFIVSIASGFYTAAYTYLLYKQAREAYDEKKPNSVTWMIVVAIVGWVIAGLIGYGIVKTVKNSNLQELITKAVEQEMGKSGKGSMMDELVGNTSRDMSYTVLFDSINAKRAEVNLPPIELDTQLCAYSTKRLKQLEDFGKFDDNAGFLADAQDQTIWTTFFRGYQNVNTLVFDRTGAVGEEEGLASKLSLATGDNSSLISDKFDAYCARADEKFVVFMMGKKK